MQISNSVLTLDFCTWPVNATLFVQTNKRPLTLCFSKVKTGRWDPHIKEAVPGPHHDNGACGQDHLQYDSHITYHWQLLSDASLTTDNCWMMHHIPLTIAQQCIIYHWQLLNNQSLTTDNCSTMHHLPLTTAQQCIINYWQLLNNASFTTDNCSTMHHLLLTIAQQCIICHWRLLNNASFTTDNCSTMHHLPLTTAQQGIIYHWQPTCRKETDSSRQINTS